MERSEMQAPEISRTNIKCHFTFKIRVLTRGPLYPSIFLAKTLEEKRLIVDGYQRIMTVYDYVKTGIFGGDQKPFKLSNSEIINERWRGKMFAELPQDEQRKIRNSAIHAIVFEQKHPQNDTGMYQIFERINTSGRVLKPQEIRNCVYHGKFNHLLFELNKLPVWRKILNEANDDARMSDVELILRAFAFSNFSSQPECAQRQINLVKYLNLYMGRNSSIADDDSTICSELFFTVMALLLERIGANLFRNAKLKEEVLVYSSKMNPSILDSVYAATTFAYQKDAIPSIDTDLLVRYENLLKTPEYQQAITTRTTNVANIKKRINLAAQILFGVEYEW